MAQPFTSNHSNSSNVAELKREIQQLKKDITLLEDRIQHIQENCKHIFLEVEGFRKCTKCHKVEVYYY